jgi:hypothetical protein
VLVVGRRLPCDAQARQGPVPVVAPDQPGAIPPQAPVPLLRDLIPALGEAMPTLPSFWRDTSLKLHLRTFYFNRQNSDDTANAAWTVGYTSQPLYAPASRDGTRLLGPDQSLLLVLGQLYGQLRYKEYALLTGYRQLVAQGYVNPQDSRMIPKTFEGVTD